MGTPDSPAISGPSNQHDVVVTEHVLLSLNITSADVITETFFRFPPTHIPEDPPVVKAVCSEVKTWTFSGQHQTAVDGTAIIRFSKFLKCSSTVSKETLPPAYMGLPYFVATPLTDKPCFLSFEVSSTDVVAHPGQTFLPTHAKDVAITVKTWNRDGTPASKVDFDWIAIATAVSETNF